MYSPINNRKSFDFSSLRSYHSTNVLSTPSSNILPPNMPTQANHAFMGQQQTNTKHSKPARNINGCDIQSIQCLSGCAHFHYENVELGPINIRLDAACRHSAIHPCESNASSSNGTLINTTNISNNNNNLANPKLSNASSNSTEINNSDVACFWFKVRSNDRVFAIQRSYASAVAFDRQLHRCVFDRRFSRLPELHSVDSTMLRRNTLDEILFALQSYMIRLSEIAGSVITCFPVLKWIELDNRGNRLLPQEDTPINTPAIGAAFVVRKHTAMECDELALQVGDIVSVIDMPPASESVWWRGKLTIMSSDQSDKSIPNQSHPNTTNNHIESDNHIRTNHDAFQVGFFPSECVQLFGTRLHQHIPRGINISNTPIGKNRGKIVTFMTGFLPNRPSRKLLKATGILKERVFGCDLAEHVAASACDVPLVVRTCVEYIEEHAMINGIYRQSGRKLNIQRLRQQFDECTAVPNLVDADYVSCDIHCVGGVLKEYFRELPNPLFTYHLYSQFMDVVSRPNEVSRVEYLRLLVQQLPPPNFRTADYLLRHLAYMSEHKTQTEMNSENLAICWAPNLFRSHAHEQCSQSVLNSSSTSYLCGVSAQANITQLMITHVQQIFTANNSMGMSPTISENSPSKTVMFEYSDSDMSKIGVTPRTTTPTSTHGHKVRHSRPCSATKLMDLSEARIRMNSVRNMKVPDEAGLPDITRRKCIDVRPDLAEARGNRTVNEGDNSIPELHSVIDINPNKRRSYAGAASTNTVNLNTSMSQWWTNIKSGLGGSVASRKSQPRPTISEPLQRSKTTDVPFGAKSEMGDPNLPPKQTNVKRSDSEILDENISDPMGGNSNDQSKGWHMRRQRLSLIRRQRKIQNINADNIQMDNESPGASGSRHSQKGHNRSASSHTTDNRPFKPPPSTHKTQSQLGLSPLRSVLSAESVFGSIRSKGVVWRKSIIDKWNGKNEIGEENGAAVGNAVKHRSRVRPELREPGLDGDAQIQDADSLLMDREAESEQNIGPINDEYQLQLQYTRTQSMHTLFASPQQATAPQAYANTVTQSNTVTDRMLQPQASSTPTAAARKPFSFDTQTTKQFLQLQSPPATSPLSRREFNNQTELDTKKFLASVFSDKNDSEPHKNYLNTSNEQQTLYYNNRLDSASRSPSVRSVSFAQEFRQACAGDDSSLLEDRELTPSASDTSSTRICVKQRTASVDLSPAYRISIADETDKTHENHTNNQSYNIIKVGCQSSLPLDSDQGWSSDFGTDKQVSASNQSAQTYSNPPNLVSSRTTVHRQGNCQASPILDMKHKSAVNANVGCEPSCLSTTLVSHSKSSDYKQNTNTLHTDMSTYDNLLGSEDELDSVSVDLLPECHAQPTNEHRELHTALTNQQAAIDTNTEIDHNQSQSSINSQYKDTINNDQSISPIISSAPEIVASATNVVSENVPETSTVTLATTERVPWRAQSSGQSAVCIPNEAESSQMDSQSAHSIDDIDQSTKNNETVPPARKGAPPMFVPLVYDSSDTCDTPTKQSTKVTVYYL